jgi:hypothetical protein
VPGQYEPDLTVPGPGFYYCPPEFGKDARKFSFKSRKDTTVIKKEDKVPGPGAYPIQITTRPGHSVLSTYRDRGVTNFASSTGTRFTLVTKAQREMPGPGNYTSPYSLGSPSILSTQTTSLPKIGTSAKRDSGLVGRAHLSPGPG